MTWLRGLFTLPLLSKELMERAARPRTYWLRFLAASALFIAFWVENKWALGQASQNALGVIGSGDNMFVELTLFLFVGIYAFVPAMLCGVVTHEKERDSLVLLLLTRLRPWQIILQKYLGGLIPALNCLLLSMPLAAIAYAFGGITLPMMAHTAFTCLLATLQIGAIAVWCSSRFRTTAIAFLMTYMVGAAFFAIPALVWWLLDLRDIKIPNREWLFVHFPPAVYYNFSRELLYRGSGVSTIPTFAGYATLAASTLAFFLAASYHLPRYAFAPGRPFLRRIFQAFDRWTQRTNRFVGGVTFFRGGKDTPGNDPLVWRERRSRALARPEYLVRLLVLIMSPLILIGTSVFAPIGSWSGEKEGLSVMAAGFGILAILVVGTTASNGIVNERVNQTFELLLTTPMTAADILRQKARALRPLVLVLSIPLLCIFGTEAAFEYESERYGPWLYFAFAFAVVLIDLPLIAWLATWVGLWCRTRIGAIICTLIAIIAWCILPIMILEWADVSNRDVGGYLYLSSPVFLPAANEFHGITDIEPSAPAIPMVLYLAIYGGALFAIRRHCLKRADHYLRR